MLSSFGALLSSSSSVHDDAGRVSSSTNVDGHVTQFEYDAAGRQTAVVQNVPVEPGAGSCGTGDPAPSGCATHRTEYEYDAAGRQVLVRDALERETQSEYDAAGNLIKTIFADGSFVTTSFDLRGRSIAETDQLGLTKQFEYDPQGNLTAVVLPAVSDPEAAPGSDPVAPRYEYEYDTYGKLIRDPTPSQSAAPCGDRS